MRFDALDQARAIAIAAMILAHFAPALIERLSPPYIVTLVVAAIGRFATPGFVAVFGVSIGLVYLPKAADNWPGVSKRLLKRAVWLMFFSVLISVEPYLDLLRSGERTLLQWILVTYSILMFYTLALAVMPLVLLMLRRRPMMVSLTAAGLLWLLAMWLGFSAWPADDQLSYLELARLLLVSGRYGFFAMLGTALAFVPLGWLIRSSMAGERRMTPLLLTSALIGLVLMGLGIGYAAVYRMTPWEVVTSPGGPPRLWFFALMAGAVPPLIYLLNRLNHLPYAWLEPFMTILSRLGRVALPVYVGHAFVLPGAHLLRWLVPGIPDGLLLPLMFLGFACYAAIVLVVRTDIVDALRVSIGSPRDSAAIQDAVPVTAQSRGE